MERRDRSWRGALLSCLCLLLLREEVESGYVAQYGLNSSLAFGERAYRYPGGNAEDVAKNRSYFISELNFDLLEGAVVTGAADQLVFLKESDLSLLHPYHWPASPENLNSCLDTESGPLDSPSSPEVPLFTCHNHIRVYQRLPSNSSLVLVCGTQAVVHPQCRILQLVSEGEGVQLRQFAAVPASAGLVSYFPQFPQFGQFRASDDLDSVFISAGFFSGENGAGRHFSISYKNINLTTTSDPSTLETEELFRTINANNNWLTFPVTFVGVEKADYSVTEGQSPSDYQFWFIFLREQLVMGEEVIYSRLARVCRNDPGSMATDNGGARHFSTFMKARIFCNRDKPSTIDFTDTLDYIYNSITSFAFSKEGRYYDNGLPPKRLLYGSFTGPGNGPVGSALCVYPADNSKETSTSSGAGRTRSVFDIFREDVANELETKEHKFLECAPGGRSEEDQQLLFINPALSVEQIGDDPILILDDVIVNHMVQDTVCVVTRGNRSACVNQDVLFLGLDSGHVLKVVFGVGGGGEVVPVISEDIELDPGDPRNVTAMKLRVVGGEKFLFVSTDTRVYKLPVQRCGRFSKCRCSDCVGSRDPYCVYDAATYTCELNQLSPSQLVDDRYWQNIHNGTVEESCDCPVVSISPANVTVGEGEGSVTFELTTSRAVSVTARTISGTAGPGDYVEVDKTLQLGEVSTVTVYITNDVALETAEEFNLSLMSDEVYFERSEVSITIQDNDGGNGTDFSLLFSAALSCQLPLEISERFTSDLIEGVVSGTRSKCRESCSDLSSRHIISPSLLLTCSEKWQIQLQGELLSTEKADISHTLLPAMTDWVASQPPMLVSGTKLTTLKLCTSQDKSCSEVTPSALDSASGPALSDGGVAGIVVAVLLFILLLAVVLVVALVIFYRKRSAGKKLKQYQYPSQPPPVSVDGEAQQNSLTPLVTRGLERTTNQPSAPTSQPPPVSVDEEAQQNSLTPLVTRGLGRTTNQPSASTSQPPPVSVDEEAQPNSLTPLMTRGLGRTEPEKEGSCSPKEKTCLDLHKEEVDPFMSCYSSMPWAPSSKSEEVELSDNVAYGRCGGEKTEGERENGETYRTSEPL